MSEHTSILTLSNVTSVGRAEIKRDGLAAQIVASEPLGYDWTARGAVADSIRRAGGWTAETVPARTKGPKGSQTVTTFGVGFSALESAVRRLVSTPKDPEAGVIRLSLSGEGGVTLTLREGDAGYAEAAALIAATVPADA